MLYRVVRALTAFALRLFYRVTVNVPAVPLDGPVIFVGNHPNVMMDPALIAIAVDRPLTFLGKAPLFEIPLVGAFLRALGALPVYRRQDDPTRVGGNEATFQAATAALEAGRAITLFPEGRSHSEPGLGELKTGCARIALRAAQRGAPVRIIPVGLTYAAKDLFRSAVLVEVGEPISVPSASSDDPAAVRALTEQITQKLRAVTLNLDAWEDLPLLQTADELYALRTGGLPRDLQRLRQFADGLRRLRQSHPERVETIRSKLASFQRRLEMIRASPSDLPLAYRPALVLRFGLEQLAALVLGLPLFVVGFAFFAIPFLLPRWVIRARRVEWVDEATVKISLALVLMPAWVLGFAAIAGWRWGWGAALAVVIVSLPLALFTRSYLERRQGAWANVRTFFTLGSRAQLKQRLLAEGDRLAHEIDSLAAELSARPEAAPTRA